MPPRTGPMQMLATFCLLAALGVAPHQPASPSASAGTNRTTGTGLCLPLVLRQAPCLHHTAAMSLDAPAAVTAGDTFTVTATLTNTGCAMLGLPRYTLLIAPEGEGCLFDPCPPEPPTHYLGLHTGQSDTVSFALRALAPGRTTLQVTCSFEVHLGYPGPAYWSGSATRAIPLTVTPRG